MPPAHLFLVDVSHQAVSTGLTASACAAVAAVLDELQGAFSAPCSATSVGATQCHGTCCQIRLSETLPFHSCGAHAQLHGSSCIRQCVGAGKRYGVTRCAGGERVRVGVATFDSAVHFYSLRSGLAAPAMLVVPDAERPFCPEPASLVVPLQASRALVRPRRGFRSL